MTRDIPIRVGADHGRRYVGSDKLATECVVNLIRTGSLIEAEVGRIFRRHGLTGPGFNVLMILTGADRALSPYQIGERLLVTRGTVTGLLDTLERQGLIRRSPHPDDRRMLQIEATTEARRLLGKVSRELFPAQAEMVSVLSQRDKQSLVRLLGRLQKHLDNGSPA